MSFWGDIIGIYLDIDKKEIAFGLNGNFHVQQGVAFKNIDYSQYLFPVISGREMEIEIYMDEDEWTYAPPTEKDRIDVMSIGIQDTYSLKCFREPITWWVSLTCRKTHTKVCYSHMFNSICVTINFCTNAPDNLEYSWPITLLSWGWLLGGFYKGVEIAHGP